MKYLKGRIDSRLYYVRDHDYRLYGYTGSDWAGSATDKNITSGGCYFMGYAMISWLSRIQSNVTLRTLISGLFDMELDTTVILCDNQSCIKMTENPMFHDKSKHIEILYFYIRDMVQKGAIKLQYVSTNEQVADVLTKPLSRVKFEYFCDNIGVVKKDFP